MEKVLTIDGRQVRFKASGAFFLRYKKQFGRDPLHDLSSLENKGDIDLEMLYNIAWTFAKTADPSILPPMEWLDTFNEFPIIDILPQLVELSNANIATTVESKKN